MKGQANLAGVKLVIPRTLPSRLSTLHKACLAATFNADPARCAAAAVGTATVQTPILAHPLSGPIYLVSHGGEAFPDTELVLQGEGITLVVDGETHISKGVTSVSFRTVPDAPFTRFESDLPSGPSSIFAGFGNLCKEQPKISVAFVGQNGARTSETKAIALSGCARPHRAAKKKRKAKRMSR